MNTLNSDGFAAWIHDDICWCANDECPHTACERNQANRLNKDGYFTAAIFKGTEACPLEQKKTFAREDQLDVKLKKEVDT